MNRITTMGVFSACLCLILCVSCSPSNQEASISDNAKDIASDGFDAGEIEVSPGHFLKLAGRFNSSGTKKPTLEELHVFGGEIGRKAGIELRVPWNGKIVQWKDRNSIPFNLREFDGKLFLTAFDRETLGVEKAYFRYFKQSNDRLIEIGASEYPKQVAGQNMWFGSRYFMSNEGKRDEVQVARDLDPSDHAFRVSLTAKVWNHLSKNVQYSESRYEIDKDVLEEFIRLHKPISLTKIYRDELVESDTAKEP